MGREYVSKKRSSQYAQLLERQKAAHDAGFYYEACWLAYAILEDRTRSILINSGDGTGSGQDLSKKIKLIIERIEASKAKVVKGRPVKDKKTGNKVKVPKWPSTHTTNATQFLIVKRWTRKRNDLAHGLASGKISLTDSDRSIKRLSLVGLRLVREVCSVARRVKKQNMNKQKQQKIKNK